MEPARVEIKIEPLSPTKQSACNENIQIIRHIAAIKTEPTECPANDKTHSKTNRESISSTPRETEKQRKHRKLQQELQRRKAIKQKEKQKRAKQRESKLKKSKQRRHQKELERQKHEKQMSQERIQYIVSHRIGKREVKFEIKWANCIRPTLESIHFLARGKFRHLLRRYLARLPARSYNAILRKHHNLTFNVMGEY